MKKIIIPVLSVVLGLAQVLILFAYSILYSLWHFKPLNLIVFSKHGYDSDSPFNRLLGLLDGTYGVISYILPFSHVYKFRGRVRLTDVVVSHHHFVETKSYIINAFGRHELHK